MIELKVTPWGRGLGQAHHGGVASGRPWRRGFGPAHLRQAGGSGLACPALAPQVDGLSWPTASRPATWVPGSQESLCEPNKRENMEPMSEEWVGIEERAPPFQR